MSEVDLSTLANIENSNVKPKLQTPMQQINSALEECGFGWFHIKILCASYFGFSAGVTITNTVPYIMPNAECDLEMDLVRKGILSAIPYLGMMLSSIVAGFLVDTFGRKVFLVGGYGLMAFFNVVSAMSQTYNMLIFSKFCEGIVFAAAFSPTVTFTSEFCHNKIRDKVMLTQSSFAPNNQIILAVMSWAILLKNWEYKLFGGYIVLHTWNFYLLFTTVFALFGCIMYSFLPESPKYLITQNRYDEARETLCYIYKVNKRKPIDTFSFANVWKDKIAAIEEEAEQPKVTLSQQLMAGLHNVKTMVRKPYAHYLLQFSCMIFFVMLLYNVIRMWFPQLSTIVEHYATEENQELCSMLDAYTNDARIKSLNTTATVLKECVPDRSGVETYINSIILGCACLPSYFVTGLLVNKVGKKSLLIVAGILCVGVSLGLRWSNSKAQVVALFAADIALAQLMMSLLQATTMEYFPTSIRTVAISVIMTVGRTGSLVGNILFPILLNMGCVVPFYFFTGIMFCVTLLAMVLPKKE